MKTIVVAASCFAFFGCASAPQEVVDPIAQTTEPAVAGPGTCSASSKDGCCLIDSSACGKGRMPTTVDSPLRTEKGGDFCPCYCAEGGDKDPPEDWPTCTANPNKGACTIAAGGCNEPGYSALTLDRPVSGGIGQADYCVCYCVNDDTGEYH